MKQNEHVILLIGPPGSGKSTISRMAAESLRLDTFQSGEILRQIAKRTTGGPLEELIRLRMQRSQAMPTEVYCQIVREQLVRKHERGVIFDGYPRTPEQSKATPRILQAAGLSKAQVSLLMLDAPRDVLYRRIMGRVTCKYCGAAPISGALCCERFDYSKREDDTEDRFTSRYVEYQNLLPKILEMIGQKVSRYVLDTSGSLSATVDQVRNVILGRDRQLSA